VVCVLLLLVFLASFLGGESGPRGDLIFMGGNAGSRGALENDVLR